jgi:hypothetical protein
MSDNPNWHIVGDWFDNCSCAVACPCTFAQAPDNGFCESVLFWHVREGHYGDVKLDNMSFVRVGRWEGDLWARNATGVAGLYIDEHADDRQMEALPTIIGGRAQPSQRAISLTNAARRWPSNDATILFIQKLRPNPRHGRVQFP